MDWLTGREAKIFLTVFLLTGLFAQWYGVNANSRFGLTLSIVNQGTFDTNAHHWNMGDRSYYEGNYYSDKEPGMAFIATPVYASWKAAYSIIGDTDINTENRSDWFTTNNETIEQMNNPGDFYLSTLILVILFTSTLSLSILSVLIYRLSGIYLDNNPKRLLLTFGFAFGTIITHYGASFMPNAVVTLFSFSSFYLVYTRESLSRNLRVLAGLLGGFAVVIDLTAVPVLGFTFLYAIVKFDFIPYFYILGGFLGGLPMMIYNTILFGLPWMLPRFFLDPALFPQLQQSSGIIPELTQQGVRIEVLEIIFTQLRLLFFPYRGIFYWFPILILSLFGLKQLKTRDEKLFYVVIGVFVTTLTLVASWWAWWMGGFFGARYLSVAIPFLMIPVFIAAKRIDIRVIGILVAMSILVNIAGFHGHYEDQLKDLDAASEMHDEYADQVISFQVLENPVRDYYISGLIQEGPQSRILNGLYNRDFPPDIRAYAGYEERAPAPLLFWTILLVIGVIWKKEINKKLQEHRRRVIE